MSHVYANRLPFSSLSAYVLQITLEYPFESMTIWASFDPPVPRFLTFFLIWIPFSTTNIEYRVGRSAVAVLVRHVIDLVTRIVLRWSL